MIASRRKASCLMNAMGALRDVAGDFRAAGAEDLAQEALALLDRAKRVLAVLAVQYEEKLQRAGGV